MPLESLPAVQQQAAARKARARDVEYFRKRSAVEMPWEEMGVGVALAAGALPVALAFLAIVVAALYGAVSGDLPITGFVEFLAGCATLMGVLLTTTGLAFMATGIMAAIVLPVLMLSVRLLRIRSRLTPMACFAGGLVAFVVSFPVWMTVRGFGHSEFLISLLILPGLATPFGQYGSAYVATNSQALGWLAKRGGSKRVRPADGARFSIWQTLMLMAIVSALLAGLQLAGDLRLRILIALAVWGVYQLVPLWLTIWLIDRGHRKRIERILNPPAGIEAREMAASAPVEESRST